MEKEMMMQMMQMHHEACCKERRATHGCRCGEGCNCGDEPAPPMPRLGEPAPAFKANTTQGHIDFPADYQGKWVILFSHPADFTPVCTTEIMTFGEMYDEFEALNCQLIGLSIDSVHSHVAWMHTMYHKIIYAGIEKPNLTFPIIDDVSMRVAHKYGMLQPAESHTAAVRAVFFIDPEGIVRAIIYYPLALGRNFKELKRVVIGLQTIDKYKVALPANWRPGDEVVVHSPITYSPNDAEPPQGEFTYYDWFLVTRKLSPEEEVPEL